MFIRAKDFQTMNANGKNTYQTVEFDDLSLHAIYLELGGTFTKAMISRIQVKCAGHELVNNITGTQLQTINTWKGMNGGDATILVIPIGNPEMVSFRDKHYTDLDLSYYKGTDGHAAILEIQLDVAGATNPTCRVLGEVYPPKKSMGFSDKAVAMTKRWDVSPVGPLASALTTQQNQPIEFGQKLKSKLIHEYIFNANLTDVEVKRGQTSIWQRLTVAESGSILTNYGHPTQLGMYVISYVPEGHIDRAVGSLATFQRLITTSAADTLIWITEQGMPDLLAA